MSTSVPMNAIDERKSDFFSRINHLNESELDDLPFGAIQLDSEGIVLNTIPTSRRSPMGPKRRHWKEFLQGNRSVYGCEGVLWKIQGRRNGENLYAKFRYHFSFKKNPRDVVVTLFYSDVTHTVWVFVRPLGHS